MSQTSLSYVIWALANSSQRRVTPAKVGHMTRPGDCQFCMGIIIRHWCDECNKIHEFGHADACPRNVGCPSIEVDYNVVCMRDE